MNGQRAQELSLSSKTKKVFFNGKRVYIDNVFQQVGVATIHYDDKPNKIEGVPVTSLTEE
ncbi:small acid-soluble spore protein, H-type [Alteribacillus persepolensis]|uniref:Small acid-soluble spore protein, H-type n=1 Tax=Alteribacillus persepolensis TaxID=568899 RepID=A0A1G8KC72_9BACI|nr:H-type small acid-soluble spore protein [Alteribacillus persepolensis]SDI40460.1 small acid-soluble spore protein, H-type [Alteribacillus persepolensis]